MSGCLIPSTSVAKMEPTLNHDTNFVLFPSTSQDLDSLLGPVGEEWISFLDSQQRFVTYQPDDPSISDWAVLGCNEQQFTWCVPPLDLMQLDRLGPSTSLLPIPSFPFDQGWYASSVCIPPVLHSHHPLSLSYQSTTGLDPLEYQSINN
jgi:hypothetical protein